MGGFKFDQSGSTDQAKRYRSLATILSLKDYNDDAKVSQCLSQGCQYSFNMILTVTPTDRSLELNAFFNGALGLNQLVVIDKITLYYDNVKVTK